MLGLFLDPMAHGVYFSGGLKFKSDNNNYTRIIPTNQLDDNQPNCVQGRTRNC